MTGPYDDPVMAEIGTAVELGHGGDRAGARSRFDRIREDLGDDGDPFLRCVLAHYAADVQDDPHAELRWDAEALAAATEVTGNEAVAGFYPSLHLNLADVHRRLGHDDEALLHLRRAREHVGVLTDDGYGRMIRNGIERCGERLGADVRD
ncbi:tetratricopeptide repeat protein [Pseudonocardia nematodicida]|uniref:Tetratricopeptide repeat protein n=1 Tax=Pseudonocardia nematodicida TaxID=1206997 RepID=A0ABV1KD68_9PSEU